MSLVSLANTKTFLQITDSAQDSVLNLVIPQVEDYVSKKCQRTFESTVYTNEEYDGTDNTELKLKNFPVITFTQLDRNRVTDNTDDWETIDADDYWVDTDTGIITKISDFTTGTKNYRATYTAGYASVPDDVQLAVMMIVSEFLNTRRAGGIKQESLGDHSVSFESVIQTNKVIKEILSHYRDIPLL